MGDEGQTATRVHHGDEAPTQLTPHAPPQSLGNQRAAPVGKRLGKYVVERLIGQGGMGIVVAARHEQLGEPVAIKLLHPKAAVDKIQVERFVREARATARIKSEHVVRVLDAGEEEGTNAPYIVMEYLHGRDVGRILSESGPLGTQLAIDIMIQVCEAAAGAHAHGIVHRDLKPSNFFVTTRADGTPLVKVLDFGISKAAHQEGTVDPKLTETQAVFGSPTYMSPEQIRSSKNVDARSDVWSLGVALFEMLSGKLPFVADNVSGLLASIVADAPFRLVTFNPDVPDGLEAIVLACLEKDPSRRVQSAGELAARLAPYASSEGQHLAQRIDRMMSMRGPAPSSQSFPPPPRTSRPSLPPVAPLPPLSPPTPLSGQGVVFGTTEGDLMSTTDMSQLRARRSTKMALGFVGLAIASVVAGIAIMTLASSPTPPRITSGSSTKSAAAPPPTATLPPAPIVIAPPATASSTAAPHASADSSPGTRKPGKAGAGGRNAHANSPASGSSVPATTAATPAPPTPPVAPAPPTVTGAKPSATDDRF